MNWGPLLGTSCCEMPCAANNNHSYTMVWLLVVDMVMTSGHLECASTMMIYILPSNGPVKSTCTYIHASKAWLATVMGAGVLVLICFAWFDMLHSAEHTSLALCPALATSTLKPMK